MNLFETTIRILGGLQAAFLLSGGDRAFLFRAADLGLRLQVGHRCAVRFGGESKSARCVRTASRSGTRVCECNLRFPPLRCWLRALCADSLWL